MREVYAENPLLFINSTDGRTPHGRNVRAQRRSHLARQCVPTNPQGGQYGVLDFQKPKTKAEHAVAKRQRTSCDAEGEIKAALAKQRRIRTTCETFISSSMRPMKTEFAVPLLNPSEVLALATFHIRRIAAIKIRADPQTLAETLRCRQWSCVSFAYNCFGKDPCVDNAIKCVADRVRLITGCPVSRIGMISHYSSALISLQTALNEPSEHTPQNLLAATQLLAVYEMLESLENVSWAKHIAGAEQIIQLNTSSDPGNCKTGDIRGYGCALPLFGDALMKSDVSFFRSYPWRELLWAISISYEDKRAVVAELHQCLLLTPELLLEIDVKMGTSHGINHEVDFALLDKAHELKERLQAALLGRELYTGCSNQSVLAFDMFGICLAALVCVHRTIATLRPAQMALAEAPEDAIGELCAQLLQLELGSSNAGPVKNILITTQQRSGFTDKSYP